MKNIDGLEIEQDLPFEKQEWILQRFMWLIMFLFLSAAFLGLLGGSGPFVIKKIADPNGTLEIEYERFGRYEAPYTLDISVIKPDIEDGEFEVSISKEFTDSIEIEKISPEPSSEQSTGNFITYTFETDSPETSDISFQGSAKQIGFRNAIIKTNNSDGVFINYLVYP